MGVADVCLTTNFILSPKNTGGDDNSLDKKHFCGSNTSYIVSNILTTTVLYKRPGTKHQYVALLLS